MPIGLNCQTSSMAPDAVARAAENVPRKLPRYTVPSGPMALALWTSARASPAWRVSNDPTTWGFLGPAYGESPVCCGLSWNIGFPPVAGGAAEAVPVRTRANSRPTSKRITGRCYRDWLDQVKEIGGPDHTGPALARKPAASGD